MVYICHASIDELSKAHGGQAGDQTGKEVCKRSWYAGNWSVALRPISAKVAETMAAAAEILCAGNFVGYDQWQRNDLWTDLEAVDWDPARLAKKTETDCSAFVTALARVAGVEVPRASLGNGVMNAPVTQTMRRAFASTGAFKVLLEPKYLTTDAYLQRGDILVRESGHTCIVVSNGSQVQTVAYESFEPRKYRVVTNSEPLNCRDTPGGAIVGQFQKGEILTGDSRSSDWIHVTNGGITGWSSEKYLEEIGSEEAPEVKHELVSNLTDEECYDIVMKAQRYAATLAGPGWAEMELNAAISAGITDGSRPMAFCTRAESAVMAERSKK